MWVSVLLECVWVYQMWVPEDGIIGIVELELQICGCWACTQVLFCKSNKWSSCWAISSDLKFLFLKGLKGKKKAEVKYIV